jgi:hypothetical protein
METIRSELDARADFADFGRLFQHLDAETLAHQSEGSGQATDATTGHDDGEFSVG